MKKLFHLLLIIALIVSLSACTQNSNTMNEPQTASSQPKVSDDLSKQQTSNDLDVDLTKLSSTMV